MTSSKAATFEKVLQATDLESVGLSLLCPTYHRFTTAVADARAEWSEASKKSPTPQLLTKTWEFEDTQLTHLHPH